MRAVTSLKAGDIESAQKDYLASNAILEALFKFGNLQSVMRAAMSFIGIDAGYNPSPFTKMDNDKLISLKRALNEVKMRHEIKDVDPPFPPIEYRGRYRKGHIYVPLRCT